MGRVVRLPVRSCDVDVIATSTIVIEALRELEGVADRAAVGGTDALRLPIVLRRVPDVASARGRTGRLGDTRCE